MGERLIRAGAAERTAFGVSQRLFVLSKSIRAAAQDTFLRGSPEDCRLCRQSLRDTKRVVLRYAPQPLIGFPQFSFPAKKQPILRT